MNANETIAFLDRLVADPLNPELTRQFGVEVVPEEIPEPPVRMISVRQEAAELAEASGRQPCAERSHSADCPGGCELPPALVMRDTSGSSIMSGRTYYLLCPGGDLLADGKGRIQRFEREQDALNAARERGWKPWADSDLQRGWDWAAVHDAVCAWVEP